MVGTGVSLGFPLGVSGGVLEGLQRFDAQRFPNIAATLLRAAADRARAAPWLWAADGGVHYGGDAAGGLGCLHALSLRACCRSPLGLRYVDRATFREMASYGGTTLIVIVAARLRFRSDSIIIGAFLSAAAITYFTIGARIVDYAGEVVENLAQVFMPMSSHSDAQGNLDRLRKIFVGGNRFCAFTIFPICAILIVLGKSVIEAWVGVQVRGDQLSRDADPAALHNHDAGAGGISAGAVWDEQAPDLGDRRVDRRRRQHHSQHDRWCDPTGLWGTRSERRRRWPSPTLCFLPWHLCRRLQIRMGLYLREAYLLPVMVCVAAGCRAAGDEAVVRSTQLPATGGASGSGRSGLRAGAGVGVCLEAGHADWRPDRRPRTASGRIRRSCCRKLLAGDLGETQGSSTTLRMTGLMRVPPTAPGMTVWLNLCQMADFKELARLEPVTFGRIMNT